MCVNTFNKNALSCSWYKPLNTDILFQSVAFSSTSRMSTCVHLNLCSVLLCFKRFDSRSHLSTACLLCLSAMLLLTSSFFPWKAQIFTWKKASADFYSMACCLPAWRSSQIRGSAEAVIGAHRVGYDTGNGTENRTNVHSFRLLWQEWCFKINASVIALMNAHGRLAIFMYSAQ